MLSWHEVSRGYRVSHVRLEEALGAVSIMGLLWWTTIYQGNQGRLGLLATPSLTTAWHVAMVFATVVAGVSVSRLLRDSTWIEVGLRGPGVRWSNRNGPSQPEPTAVSSFRVGHRAGGSAIQGLNLYWIEAALMEGPVLRVLDDWETTRGDKAEAAVRRLNELLITSRTLGQEEGGLP